jgi:acetyl-CoA carboxylase carboxyl transferase subunit alpha
LESEELNIGGSIALSLQTMSNLRVPTIAAIIGEGGSGGALAIGVADRVLMLENATYSVITPEGAAAILWKDKERVREAAAALKLTAPHLLELGLIDAVIPEPLGGAHKDFEKTAAALKQELLKQLGELDGLRLDELLARRYERYRRVGRFVDVPVAPE